LTIFLGTRSDVIEMKYQQLVVFFIWLVFFNSDFDECVSDSTNDCHVNATCANTEGSFQCMCLEGFSGDGVNCSGKIDQEENKFG